MKRQHRIPAQAYEYHQPVIDSRYQAEVDAAVSRAERAVRIAERRLAAAETALRRRKASPKTKRHTLAEAEAIVALRREELLEVQRLAQSAPSSAAHRGLGHQKRPVPGQSTI